MSRPLFSIGVTTYNRPELLKQCLQAILAQTCGDFEVLVGNDYQAQPLSAGQLGFDDPRLRILNHENNLGELGNMNALLEHAHGEYFTWIADDDYHDPAFLEDVRGVLGKTQGVRAVFPSYANVRFYGHEVRLLFRESSPVLPSLLTGRQFLRDYWLGKIKTCGLWGVYQTDYMRKLGGAANLTNNRIAIMSEMMDLIYTGLLDQVIYLDRPLIYSRAHLGSWSCSSSHVNNYKFACTSLLRRSLPVLQDRSLRDDFEINLTGLLQQMVLLVVAKISARPGGGYSFRAMTDYLAVLERECMLLVEEPLRAQAQASLRNARIYLYKIAPVFACLSLVPAWFRPLLNRMHGIVKGEITG